MLRNELIEERDCLVRVLVCLKKRDQSKETLRGLGRNTMCLAEARFFECRVVVRSGKSRANEQERLRVGRGAQALFDEGCSERDVRDLKGRVGFARKDVGVIDTAARHLVGFHRRLEFALFRMEFRAHEEFVTAWRNPRATSLACANDTRNRLRRTPGAGGQREDGDEPGGSPKMVAHMRPHCVVVVLMQVTETLVVEPNTSGHSRRKTAPLPMFSIPCVTVARSCGAMFIVVSSLHTSRSNEGPEIGGARLHRVAPKDIAWDGEREDARAVDGDGHAVHRGGRAHHEALAHLRRQRETNLINGGGADVEELNAEDRALWSAWCRAGTQQGDADERGDGEG